MAPTGSPGPLVAPGFDVNDPLGGLPNLTREIVAPESVLDRPVEEQAESSRSVNFRRASEVEVSPVRWAWTGRIPLEHVSVLAGRPGLGKTTLAIELAARVTRGKLEGDLAEPASVLYVTAEDVASVLTSRLIAAGGERSRLLVVDEPLQLPEAAPALAQTARNEGVRLIVIDPYSAFSTGDSHVEAEVRRAMGPLHSALAEHQIAALAIMHLNKSASSDLITRVSGSVAHTAAPRSVLLWGHDPGDDERGPLRVLAHGKSNLGPEQPSLAWRMTTQQVQADSGEQMEVGRVVAEGESDASTSDLLNGPSGSEAPEREAAKRFLLELLADGPVPSNEVRRSAEIEGISKRTLERAQASLRDDGRCVPKKTGDRWFWKLSDGDGDE